MKRQRSEATQIRAVPAKPDPVSVIAAVHGLTAESLAVGGSFSITDDEAAQMFALNRKIVKVNEEREKLIKTITARYGIALDDPVRRWHFDTGSGVFTRLPDAAPAPP